MRYVIGAAALFLTACAGAPEHRAAPGPDGFPLGRYADAPAGAVVYRVDTHLSRADIIVRRGGGLQRFGHDHVVTARAIDGYVLFAPDGAGLSHADLVIELGALSVDEADARSVYGLDSKPSESDIEGTADNMHDQVLETARWPRVHVAIVVVDQTPGAVRCEVTLRVKGAQFALPVDVLLDHDESDLRARGLFALRQTDVGIEPFSVLGGLLSVRDRLEISFLIQASRTDRITLPRP